MICKARHTTPTIAICAAKAAPTGQASHSGFSRLPHE